MVEILKLLLFEVLIDCFEMTNHKIEGEDLHSYFKEKNEYFKKYSSVK